MISSDARKSQFTYVFPFLLFKIANLNGIHTFDWWNTHFGYQQLNTLQWKNQINYAELLQSKQRNFSDWNAIADKELWRILCGIRVTVMSQLYETIHWLENVQKNV